ncbi:MAG: glycosyltransferase family 4 protein [Candidatus Krumholzibacteria bacterium]|nr:glycosyltransferase family 4 protein [Candidatus Krumholzibacteria bacterium]MDH5627098.1 glycosyltransferase family 4 protein [Candidatus Krumholzibacteria bacterium]
MRPLRIAMIGQKGLPARYGGVETHVENVAVRLAARGHRVRAYCRSRLRPRDGTAGGSYRGVELAFRPSINSKHLDAASHTFLCAAESAFVHSSDIVHLHGIGPSAFAPVAGLGGRRVVSTFHALDWRQLKWGTRAKAFLKRGEHIGARHSDGVIAVSRLMQRYIQSEHGVEATWIPNGATMPVRTPGTGALERRGLTPGGYLLTVGRIIPDRDLHTLIEAFTQSHRPKHLVIVGSETPKTAYGRMLENLASDRVLFTGDVFGEELEELYAHCLIYCLASRVEGLPITVCEAMAHARPLILSDIPENVEVGGEAARYFRCGDVNALLQTIEDLVADDPGRAALSADARRRCQSVYNWDLVADQVEAYYYRLMEGRG